MAPLKVGTGVFSWCWKVIGEGRVESELWFHKRRTYVKYDLKCITIVVCSSCGNSFMLWADPMYNLSYRGLNHSYVLTSVEKANWFIESRETLGSDRYKYPGRNPAWIVTVSPGKARGKPGESPARIVLASPGEARLWCICYSPGEAGRNHSGSSPIWTHSVDAIPAGKLYVLLLMWMLL